MLDIEGVCSHYVTLTLGLQRQAGDAHLLGQLAGAFGIEGAEQMRVAGPIYPYQIVGDCEALISAFGMAMKVELVGPNRMHIDQDDCVYERR